MVRLLSLLGIKISFSRPAWTFDSRPHLVFDKRHIKYNHKFYFYELEPPVTNAELNQYYSKAYWGARGGKGSIVNSRDFQHLSLFFAYFRSVNCCFDLTGRQRLNFLNYGSGHGGVSHFFHAMGLNISNVDPSEDSYSYSSSRYNHFISLNKLRANLPDYKADIFYSSHSLEHVVDIIVFLAELQAVTHKNSLFFFEVPDANSPGNGVQTGRQDIPHTYYFTKQFFEKIFGNIYILYSTSVSEARKLDSSNTIDQNDVAYKPAEQGIIRCIASGLRHF